MTARRCETLLSVDIGAWRQEIDAIGKYLDEFGARVPAKLRDEQQAAAKRLA